MIRVLVAFLALAVVFGFGIQLFRNLTKRQKWRLTKIAAYSILCSVLALAVLISIVILF